MPTKPVAWTPTRYLDVPSDPDAEPSDEELDFLFSGDVDGFIAEIERLGLEQYQQSHPTTQPEAENHARETA